MLELAELALILIAGMVGIVSTFHLLYLVVATVLFGKSLPAKTFRITVVRSVLSGCVLGVVMAMDKPEANWLVSVTIVVLMIVLAFACKRVYDDEEEEGNLQDK